MSADRSRHVLSSAGRSCLAGASCADCCALGPSLFDLPLSDPSTSGRAALDAFPSPASTTAALESPTLGRVLAEDNNDDHAVDGVHHAPRPKALWTPQSPMPDSSAPCADPQVPHHEVAGIEGCSDITDGSESQTNMNIIVGGALAPVSEPPAVRLLRKNDPGLRLPSFESLGIAAPQPGTALSNQNDTHHGPKALLGCARAATHILGEDVDASSNNVGGRAVPTSIQHYIATLTPPAEKSELDFALRPNLAASVTDSTRIESVALQQSLASPSVNLVPSQPQPGVQQPSPSTPASSETTSTWIDSVLHTIVPSISAKAITKEPIKILSQALPCTSATGHIYPAIVTAVQGLVENTVELHHAISGNFNLACLPTSPPTTPRSTGRSEDYFEQVYATGVQVSDYQNKNDMAPRSPRPVVSPSSVHISIVERYIPPSSPREFAHMFRPSGPSLLIDRLVELSPKQGSLVFIYPTQTGARTFVKKYLGPIIEPQLRSLVVANGISTHIGRALGDMVAVEKMLSFDQLHHSLERLCNDMADPAASMTNFRGTEARFEVIHASRQQVPLEREVWAQDWWTKQEKPRVRELLTRFAREAEKRSSNAHLERPTSAAELIQRLLDGIISRPYEGDQSPTEGIEVGAFVIQRTQ